MSVLKGTDKTTAGMLESFLTGILTKSVPDEDFEDVGEPVIYTIDENKEE